MFQVTDYPQLLKLLVTDQKIVYLCGAGASMSLGSHKLSWPEWILAGREYLLAAEQLELDRRIGTWSAAELINAVTYLLEKLKASGSYDFFMTKTIGSLHPVNKNFKEALRKIWRAGDLVATTNYDLQIEEAVDAQSVSYSSPGEILSIIRGGENKVIHLHGMYDRLHGIDDIVADDPQYKGILANEGAQFIQNLIGTHPIVIVGCGGTVEDPNLSGFMSFVVDKLRVTDIPYFYLVKNGDALPGLPANAIPIFYGDEYSDLPSFLLEMSLLRLRRRSGLRSLVSFNPYTIDSPVSTAFGRIHFSNGFNAFVGRENEIARLNEFLNNDTHFAWWSVVGEGGIGKSRLVMEWLRKTQPNWFGYFTNKKADEARNFKPFTDTVIVFDYVLGKEHECSETMGAYLEAFCFSPYKLRILLLERIQQTDEWLGAIKRNLEAEDRLAFEGAEYQRPLTVAGLSRDDEISYIENYLSVYLPLVESNPFMERCRADLHATSKTIDEIFRNSVEPTCYRPLYLSVFIEVWLGKEGKISLTSAEELLGEYLSRESGRWRTVFGEETLLDSYMRLLAMACAIERFNITDVYGDNYLAEDCKRLVQFFDQKSGKPGAQNVFADVFVSMDELVDDDGEDSIADVFFNSKAQENTLDKEDAKTILSLEEEDRFAYFAPYIKMQADPTEVYLNLLANVGAADDEELEQLKKVREARIAKVNALPDHAWVIEPTLPDIIKEFIVSYVINERDVVRFTKLARSNSILGFHNFLILALDDWASNPMFQKMIVTPPAEVLNFFEYYVSLLVRITAVEDIKAVEQALVDSVPCFPKFEMALWRRIAYVLHDRQDAEKQFESGCRFIEYLRSLDGLMPVREEAAEVIQEYSVGIYNARKWEIYSDFLCRLDGIKNLLPKSKSFGMVFAKNYSSLIDYKMSCHKKYNIDAEWAGIKDLLKHYDCSDEMVRIAMRAAHDYMHSIIREKHVEKLKQLESYLEKLHQQYHLADVAEVAALSTANLYTIFCRKHRKSASKQYNKLKAYLSDYPESMYIRSAYIVVSRWIYTDTPVARKVPESIMNDAKAWSLQYPGEIEFQESYFDLLFARFAYARARDMRNEQRRVLREMKAVADRADYSAYHEKNELKKMMDLLRNLYVY